MPLIPQGNTYTVELPPEAKAQIQALIDAARVEELEKIKKTELFKEHLPFTRSKSSARHTQNKLRYILWDEIDNRIAQLTKTNQDKED